MRAFALWEGNSAEEVSDEDACREGPTDVGEDALSRATAFWEKPEAEDSEGEREDPPPFDEESLHEHLLRNKGKRSGLCCVQ